MESNNICELEESLKREICSSPFVKTKEPSIEEIQSAIDELNERKSALEDSIESDYDGAINIDNILISKNFKEKQSLHKNSENENLKFEEGAKIGENDYSEKSEIDNFSSKNDSNHIKRKKSNLSVDNKMTSQSKRISDLEVINSDHYLKPFEKKIKERLSKFETLLKEIEKNEGSLLKFSESYKRMGLNVTDNGIEYREYAPGAHGITIFGDFNNWNRNEYNCQRDEFGFWSIFFPNKKTGESFIPHNSKIKINIHLSNGDKEDRNPIWSRYLRQNPDSFLYDSVFWNPEPFEWQTSQFLPTPSNLRIYEAHVGMSSSSPKVNSYREFADEVLPRIKASGYTAVQLMAIMEHAYYASFGYHVTSFFAVASRCGSPDDLKYLINRCKSLGLYVIMDIIHSHASTNVLDGLNLFDGTDYLYFHGGPRGHHKLWDSRVFNYANWETLRLLLSNLAFYMDEYHFDGFRFDGVTSMLYLNHGINYSFSGGLNEYFNENLDMDAAVYLMLANYLVKMKNRNSIVISEDVSGMPTLCRPIEEGGFGFDYRLNMSVPDKWIELLKEYKDENWNMGNICFTLTNRRFNEKHITYSESHDQSIVGDKTISMWLFGPEIYTNMSIHKPSTIVIDRGIALHKIIRLITFSLGGEAYMNFIGNEFGHPEWVDFPRAGNNNSYQYCRRQWNLCDDMSLRYRCLYEFDKAMMLFDDRYNILNAKSQFISLMHEKDKIIVFEKGDLLFVFNFHPAKSFEHYRIGTKWSSEHSIVLDTDEETFGGKSRVKHNIYIQSFPEKWMGRPCYVQLYIPSRSAIVLIAKENENKYTSI